MNKEEIHQLIENGFFNGDSIKGKLIETHISWVIISDPFVFKIKKEMKYSFLDFSTLEKRKYFCEREVSLNQRLTDIYLDVVEIRKNNNQYTIGQMEGELIDYAVRMKKLQASNKMDLLLEEEKVTKSQIKVLAKSIAHFHINAEIINTAFDKEKSKTVFNDIQNVQSWVKEQLGKDCSNIIAQAIQYSDSFLGENELLFVQRISEGFQRDVHGDLHSRNIFLDNKPILFDCIEFNDSFRQIDLLDEIAFFCMDLEAFGRNKLSKQFVEEYLSYFFILRNEEEKALFNYYKCYRANVRAKVSALRGMQCNSKKESKQHTTEVHKYLKLMKKYLNYSQSN